MSKFKDYIKKNYIIPKLLIVIPLILIFIIEDIPFYGLGLIIVNITLIFGVPSMGVHLSVKV